MKFALSDGDAEYISDEEQTSHNTAQNQYQEGPRQMLKIQH